MRGWNGAHLAQNIYNQHGDQAILRHSFDNSDVSGGSYPVWLEKEHDDQYRVNCEVNSTP